MRIYKYFYFAVISLLCTLITSSNYISYAADGRFDYEYVRVKFSNDNCSDIIDIINELKTKHDVNVYIPDTYNENNSQINCDYYTDKYSKDELQNKYTLYEGKYRVGLFSNSYSYSVRYLPFDNVVGEISHYHYICAIGENSNSFIIDLKKAISEKYNKDILDENTVIKKGTIICNNILVWIIGEVIILVIVAFEVSLLRKEAVISMINGISLIRFILKHLLNDIIVCSILLAAVNSISLLIGGMKISTLYSINATIAFIVCSFIIYLTLYITNLKAVLSNVKQGARVIYFNHAIKALGVILSFLLLGELLSVINDNKGNDHAQETINNYCAGYYYADILNAIQNSRYYSDDDPLVLPRRIYTEHYDDLKPLVLNGHKGENGESIVQANAYAMEYIYSVIPELKDVNSENKLIVAGKKGDKNFETFLRKDKEALEELKRVDPARAENTLEPTIVYYEKSADILCIGADTNTKTEYFKNPIISISLETGEDLIKKGTSMSFNALKLDKEKTAMLCKEYDLNEKDLALCTITETFEKQWGVGKAAIASHIALEAVVLFVVMLISISVLKFTFITKAKELCIKKICGHGFIARYCTTFLLSLAMYVPAYIYAIYTDNKATFNANTAVITLFTLAVIAIDLLVSLPYIIKKERANISKVLKGGAL